MNFLQNIPLTRGLLYVIGVGLLPFCFLFFQFSSKEEGIQELQERITDLQNQVMLKEGKQALNIAVRQHFKDADHFYIDKQVESLNFLEPELQVLQESTKDKNFTDDERVKKRIEFLSGPSNSLQFSEGVVQNFPFFQETIETLIHPVEVNAEDIKKILSRIEGVQIGSYQPAPDRPQLVITDFQIDKKKVTDQNETFLLNIKLIKREFL